MLSCALWRQKFGGRADVPDEPIMMNGEPYTVIGVMAESFDFPNSEAKLWVPADLDGPLFTEHPDAHFLRVIGRLKPGISRDAAASRSDVLGKRVDDPADKTERRFFALSLKEMITRRPAESASRFALRGWISPAHRLRECREPDAGAGHHAPGRDGACAQRWARAGRA